MSEKARLMTTDEIMNDCGSVWLEEWLEADGEDPEIIELKQAANCFGHLIDRTGATYSLRNWSKYYNRKFGIRVWTAEPDDETRAAARWLPRKKG